jgi:hypothetical protein
MPDSAILVGVTFKGTIYELKGCAPDIRIMEDLMRRRGIQNVTILDDTRYPSESPRFPTRDNTMRVFKRAADGLRPDDRLYIHISSHGFFLDGKNAEMFTKHGKTIDEATTECLLLRSPQVRPSNGHIDIHNTICNTQITHLFVNIPETARVFMSIDTCYAGNMFDLPFTVQCRSMRPRRLDYVTSVHPGAPAVGDRVAVLIAVKERKFAVDAKDKDGKNYGRFTKALVELLEEARQSSTSLTYFDVLFYVQRRLGEGPDRQDPQLSIGSSRAGEQKIWV